jgi:hypothetical protein
MAENVNRPPDASPKDPTVGKPDASSPTRAERARLVAAMQAQALHRPDVFVANIEVIAGDVMKLAHRYAQHLESKEGTPAADGRLSRDDYTYLKIVREVGRLAQARRQLARGPGLCWAAYSRRSIPACWLVGATPTGAVLWPCWAAPWSSEHCAGSWLDGPSSRFHALAHLDKTLRPAGELSGQQLACAVADVARLHRLAQALDGKIRAAKARAATLRPGNDASALPWSLDWA